MCTREQYLEMYGQSISDPEGFWGQQADRIDWIKPFTGVKNTDFTGDVSIKWFEDGTLNASVNCIDRYLTEKADDTAVIFEGDEPTDSRHITCGELHRGQPVWQCVACLGCQKRRPCHALYADDSRGSLRDTSMRCYSFCCLRWFFTRSPSCPDSGGPSGQKPPQQVGFRR